MSEGGTLTVRESVDWYNRDVPHPITSLVSQDTALACDSIHQKLTEEGFESTGPITDLAKLSRLLAELQQSSDMVRVIPTYIACINRHTASQGNYQVGNHVQNDGGHIVYVKRKSLVELADSIEGRESP